PRGGLVPLLAFRQGLRPGGASPLAVLLSRESTRATGATPARLRISGASEAREQHRPPLARSDCLYRGLGHPVRPRTGTAGLNGNDGNASRHGGAPARTRRPGRIAARARPEGPPWMSVLSTSEGRSAWRAGAGPDAVSPGHPAETGLESGKDIARDVEKSGCYPAGFLSSHSREVEGSNPLPSTTSRIRL